MQKAAAPRHPAEPPPLHIALLGAAGTGKTRLAADLQLALAGNPKAASRLQISDNPPLTSLLKTSGPHGASRTRLLLMGLDLPAPQGTALSQAAADLDLRQSLRQADLAYSVIYGLGQARLQHALEALRSATPGDCAQAEATGGQRPWVWACDTCSDPGCERRLLSALLAARSN